MRPGFIWSDGKFGFGFSTLFRLAGVVLILFQNHTYLSVLQDWGNQWWVGGGAEANPQEVRHLSGDVCTLGISQVPAKTQTIYEGIIKMPNPVKYKGKYSLDIGVQKHEGIQSLTWLCLSSHHTHSACSDSRLPFLRFPNAKGYKARNGKSVPIRLDLMGELFHFNLLFLL